MLIDAGLRDKRKNLLEIKLKKNIKSKPKSHADKVQVTFHTLRHTFLQLEQLNKVWKFLYLVKF